MLELIEKAEQKHQCVKNGLTETQQRLKQMQKVPESVSFSHRKNENNDGVVLAFCLERTVETTMKTVIADEE